MDAESRKACASVFLLQHFLELVHTLECGLGQEFALWLHRTTVTYPSMQYAYESHWPGHSFCVSPTLPQRQEHSKSESDRLAKREELELSMEGSGLCLFSGCCAVLCCAKLLQSWTTLCNPMDCSLPGSSVNGILQARILEWVANSFSRGSSWPRDQTVSLTPPALAGRFFTTSATWETSLLSRETLFFSKCVLPDPFASQPDIACTTSNRIRF